MRSWLSWASVASALLTVALAGPAWALDGAGLTSVLEPAPYDSLEVFWANADGSVASVYKEHNGRWMQPYALTDPGMAVPGGAFTAVWSVMNDQLEVFWVGKDGAVNDIWKDHDSDWHNPIKVSSPGFAAPGAPLSGVWQPVTHELLVFGVGPDGTLNVASKRDNQAWFPSRGLSLPNVGVAGEKPAAVYQPLNQHVEVFTVSPDGKIYDTWKAFDGAWNAPIGLTGTQQTPPGSSVAAVFQPQNNQLEVFYAGTLGAVDLLWKIQDGTWNGPRGITDLNSVAPGSSISAVYQDLHQHVEVFATGLDGAIVDEWRSGTDLWQPSIEITNPNTLPSGTTLSAVIEPTASQIEVMYHDGANTVWDAWKQSDGAWNPPIRLTSLENTPFITAGACTNYFNRWRDFQLQGEDDYMMQNCQQIMGVTAYCAKQDANPLVDNFTEQGGHVARERLICVPKSHPDTIGQQADHIVKGVSEGLSDAMTAAAPYLGPVVEGVSCANGVIYACAALALDIVDRTLGDAMSSDVKTVLQIGNDALACANGNVATCASLGAQGIKAATGFDIPGGDIAQNILDSKDCDDGSFTACARLGEQAAEAAGLPRSTSQNIATAFVDARACLSTIDADTSQDKVNVKPCADLGTQLVAAAVPRGGLADAINLAQDCSNGVTDACEQLGKEAAVAAGVPVDLANAVTTDATACTGGDTPACIAIGAAAARVSGVPLDDIAPLQQCANGDVNACAGLASKATDFPVTDAATTAKLVSQCASGDANACAQLGQDALAKYGPKLTLPNTTESLQVIPDTPAPATGASFAGTWISKVQNGVTYTLTLSQDEAGHVSGSYNTGTFSDGVVVGHVLDMRWQQGQAAGIVEFDLAPDGATFSGLWSQGDALPTPTAANGTWDGYRSDIFTGPATTGFAGDWTLDRGGSTAPIALHLDSLADGTLSGDYSDPGGILRGHFVQQAGHPDALAYNIAFAAGNGGQGSFYLYPDGQHFSGIWRQTDGIFAAWSATRAPAPADAALGPGSEGPGAGGPGSEGSGSTGGPGSDAPAAPIATPGSDSGDQIPSAPEQPGTPGVGVVDEVPVATPQPAPAQPGKPAQVQTPAPIQQSPKVPASPIIILPTAACPAAQAITAGPLAVHEGETGAVVPPPIATGTQIQCVACDKIWCLIADSDPHAVVPRGFLKFGEPKGAPTPQQPITPPAAQPAQQPTAPQPQRPSRPKLAATANFNGDWSLRSDRDWKDELILRQTGTAVTGSFVDQSGLTGQVLGQVQGNTLNLSWTEDGGHSGTGSFVMGADQASISGSFGPDPDSVAPSSQQGKWQGPRRDATSNFSGGWIVVSSLNWTYFFKVQQSGNAATASFTDQNGNKGQLSGVVADDTWYYFWSEDGGYTGGGTFTMAIDSNGFAGVYHANANGKLAESSGSWSGKPGGGGTVLPGPAAPAAAPAAPSPPDFGDCAKCSNSSGDIVVK